MIPPSALPLENSVEKEKELSAGAAQLRDNFYAAQTAKLLQSPFSTFFFQLFVLFRACQPVFFFFSVSHHVRKSLCSLPKKREQQAVQIPPLCYLL
jgi:hypothetical protein